MVMIQPPFMNIASFLFDTHSGLVQITSEFFRHTCLGILGLEVGALFQSCLYLGPVWDLLKVIQFLHSLFSNMSRSDK